MSDRYTIAVDFDGVLHQYTTPWIAPHVIPDPPVPGAVSWLFEMIQHFDVVIHTTRGRTWRGRRAIRRWLKTHADSLWYPTLASRGLEDVVVTNKKPKALIYLDDRAVRFTGSDWPTKDQVHRLRPWNKQETKS